MLSLKQYFGFKASLVISTGLAFLLYGGLYLQSNGLVEGGQDSYNHFLISKYAFKYPHLLLDQWGKPIYTLLAHPFCAFGLGAAVWFNILCTIFAAILCALTSKNLGAHLAVAAFWICAFSPIVLGKSISSLTEPLNMLALSAAFYSWTIDKKVIACILFSLMPWIRTEGFVIVFPFLVFLIIHKHFKLIPWLLSTTIIINFIGWWQTGEPLWFITNNPYFLVETEADRFAPEGGSLLYYLQNNKFLFGNIFFPIAVFGALWICYRYWKGQIKLGFTFWVILGVFVAYYFAHSFIMWKGMLGTHGMLRVMAVIVPSTAIAFALFWNIFNVFNLKKLISAILFIFISMGVFSSYKVNGYPTRFWRLDIPSVQQITIFPEIKEANSYIKANGLDTAVIYHQIPVYNVLFDKNPFPKPLSSAWETENIWSIDLENNWAPKGSIMLWDNYHAAREGNIPKTKFYKLEDYKVLQKFGEDTLKNPTLILFKKFK